MPKSHVLCQGTHKFAVSERLRRLCCLTGQAEVYSQASELLQAIGHIEISGMQIQRMCTHYGNLLDPLIGSNCEAVLPRLEPTPSDLHVYVMVDGAMLFTRPDEWREIKLGRIFTHDTVVQLSPSRRQAQHSIYVSHLGSVADFFPKLERHLTSYPRKVIVGDGAKWIWNWAEDNYPGAIQILDFFHAKEKLVDFARYHFSEDDHRLEWIETQSQKLLNNEVEEVMDNVRRCRVRSPEARKAKEKLLKYYVEHDDRMNYKTYQEQGLLIGSGPIEAAHRNVIQQRMKRSGQKWSVKGAQAIANLRCYRCSKAWNMVEKVIAAA